jgi:hypothetical protein
MARLHASRARPRWPHRRGRLMSGVATRSISDREPYAQVKKTRPLHSILIGPFPQGAVRWPSP